MAASQWTDDGAGRGAGEAALPVVVGIGASAGGLEALEQLFARVPERSGLAYVVVQHLAPDHASMLAHILGRQTAMKVVEATDGAVPEADHVYVIVPGTVITISGGALRVRAADEARHGAIDAFLRSLAEDQGARAAGVVLSGSGGDGAEGLGAIKDRGGLTVVQAPETAKYDGMPRAAIDAGVADRILPVEAMPAALIARAREVGGARGPAAPPSSTAGDQGDAAPSDDDLVAALGRIFEILRRSTGHDFSHYKRGTVLRRLRRRLAQRRASLPAYLDLLGADREEPELLSRDLRIGVTELFRDPEVFDHLGAHVVPRILSSGDADRPVRIWVAGCASGEEAYSIGILVRERMADLGVARPVQIFATDIDPEAIAEARRGRYAAEAVRNVPAARLSRFFTQAGGSYQVTREVREMCIFSEHSVIRAPPFLSLDLISCRNLLIYLDAALQRKLVPVFHFALRPGGYLVLGSSESLAGHPELFETVDKRLRIFRRAEAATRPAFELPLVSRAAPRAAPSVSAPALDTQAVTAAFERLMLQEYTPPGAVVNVQGDVLCVAGLTGRYLQPPAGILSTNVLEIAHVGLRIELRTALHTAARTRRRVVHDDVPVEIDGAPRRLRVSVRPLPGVKQDGLFVIVLEERPSAAEPGEPLAPGSERESAMEQLESELISTRASLRATIEELESANEELKSSNEELLSTNEEMQSSNEELQSSQEELKSVNEELATVNAELTRRVDEIGRANSDLSNLFSSTDVATLFLDREQRLTRFTPAGKALFRLIEADAGRPIADLAPRFAGEDLAADVGEVLRALRPIERHVETIDRRAWYLLRVLPYRTLEDVIAGAVVTLTDITQIKRAEADRERLVAELRAAQAQLGADLDATSRLLQIGSLFLQEGNLTEVLEQILDAAIAVAGADFGNVQILDRASGRLRMGAHRGLPADWVEFWREVGERQGASGTALARKERVIVEDVEASPIFAGTAGLAVHLAAGVRAITSTPLLSRAGELLGTLTLHYRTPTRPGDRALRLLDLVARQAADMLERAQAGLALEEANARLEEADRRKNDFLGMLSHELRNPLAAIQSSVLVLDRAAAGGEDALRALAVIGRQAEHLGRMIEDVLDVTRITRGKVQLQREVLDLSALARRTVEDLRHAFADAGVALDLRAPGAPVWVNGDRTRIAQVIGNLLQNAVKFTPRGGATTVSVEAGARAILRVEDTGPGIPAEVLPRIFDAFTQADTTLDRSRGGLGLGLAVVKGMVEMHGGSVEVGSSPGEGAAFTVALPLVAPPAPSDRPAPSAPAPSSRRVLIVEDNADSADMLATALQLDGHVVEVAGTGRRGVEKAGAFRPDVVICDLGLPDMDGYAVARALRADPAFGRTKLVALSGYTRSEDVEKSRAAGFDAHLAKPASFEALSEVLCPGA